MKILPFILILALLLLLYPLCVGVKADRNRLQIFWRPFSPAKWRVCLLAREFAPPKLLLAVAEEDWEGAVDLLLKKRKDKAEATPKGEKQNSPNRRLRPWLLAVFSALRVEKLAIRAKIGGDPYRAAILSGTVWAIMSALLARLSAAVKCWRPRSGDCLQMGLMPQPSRFWDSQVEINLECRLCLGRVLLNLLVGYVKKTDFGKIFGKSSRKKAVEKQ